MRPLALLAGLSPLLLATTALAATTTTTPPLVVGACRAPVLGYQTIGAAIAAAPAGATIDVCPGTYPEQLAITKNLTLVGIPTATSSASVITAPAGGIVANATSLDSGNPIAAQIVVKGATAVTIGNLIVDGANNAIAGCAPDLVGILFQDASGIIRNNTVANQALTNGAGGLGGCQSGEGIFAQSDANGGATILVQNNTVTGFQKNGITGNDANTNLTVLLNTVTGQGPTTGAAENGIQLAFGATGRIQSNTIADLVYSPVAGNAGNAAAGILVYASPKITITTNTIANTQFGIAVSGDNNADADGATLTANHIQATHSFDGIDICGAGSATISGNYVNSSDEAAIHLDSSCGAPSTGNTVSSNHVDGACAALLLGTGSAGSSSGNNFYDATAITLSGSDICPAAATTSSFRHVSHARPLARK